MTEEVKVSKQQLEQLSKAEALIDLLLQNKETKRDFERMVKKVNPKAVTTDDIAEPYVGELKEELKSIKEWQSGMNKKIDDYNYGQQIENLRTSGYTKDGIEAIEKIAKDRKVDLDLAAAYFDKTRPVEPVAPNGLSPSVWQFAEQGSDEEDQKLLLKNDDAWLEKRASKAIGEWRDMNKGRAA